MGFNSAFTGLLQTCFFFCTIRPVVMCQIKTDICIAVNHNTFLLSRSTHVTCFGRSENLQAFLQPYPPSLNKTPAKTIDLRTGASAWALGSHKGTKNIDILTKKKNQNRTNIEQPTNQHTCAICEMSQIQYKCILFLSFKYHVFKCLLTVRMTETSSGC